MEYVVDVGGGGVAIVVDAGDRSRLAIGEDGITRFGVVIAVFRAVDLVVGVPPAGVGAAFFGEAGDERGAAGADDFAVGLVLEQQDDDVLPLRRRGIARAC